MASRSRRGEPLQMPPKRWACRYSPSEMMYLEMTATGVRSYLDHSPDRAEHTTFAEVLAGRLDAEVTNLFGTQALAELKDEVRRHMPTESGGIA